MRPDVIDVMSTLAHYASLTGAAMDTWLAGREPEEYLYGLVSDYPHRGGKALRPALLLAACEAFGRPASVGLSSAVALEMLHNAFLVHDDIEDSSRLRRGRPTLHLLHGLPLALNAGDALASLALRPVLDDQGLSPHSMRGVLREVAAAVQKTTEGQARELGWRRHPAMDVTPEDYLEVVGRKTCWYTTVTPLRIGALLGSDAVVPLRPVSQFGFYLGVAFQIRDDLLDLDSTAASGKEAYHDLREKKLTLMLTHLLARARAKDQAWLLEYLAAPDGCVQPADLERVLELFEAYGSIAYAQEYARGIEAAAHAAFADAFSGMAPSPHLTFLHDVIAFARERRS